MTRSTDPLLGYEIKPSFRATYPAGDASSNRHGRRDRERTPAKANGTRRILVLGDSVVEGINYVDDENTITRQWEKLYPDGETEVLNFGTSGYCTLAEVALLRKKGLAFKPDLVVVLFVYNDFDNFNPEHTVGVGVTERPVWSKHLFIASSLFRYLCLSFNWFEFASETDPTALNRAAIGDNNVVEGFRQLREMANEHQFQVLIATWPAFGDREIFQPHEMPDGRLIVERLAAMNGLPIVRLVDHFESAWMETRPLPNPRLAYTVRGDGMHPNAVGATLAARILRDQATRNIPTPPYSLGPPDLEAVSIAGQMGQQNSFAAQSFEDRSYQALMRQGRADAAERYLRDLLAKNPDHRTASFHLGRHLFDLGRVAEAIDPLQAAIAAWPENAGARTRLAFGFSSLNRPVEALALLDAGLKASPDSSYLHLAAASICITNAQFKRAKIHVDMVTTLDPDHPDLVPLKQRLAAAQEPVP